MIRVFASLKWRLLRNGWRRTTRSPLAALGFAMSMLASLAGATAGFIVFSSLRWPRADLRIAGRDLGFVNDPAQVHRVIVLGAALMVVGWWFAPLVSGGVDETVDPTRLVLLPLTRTEIRRGQIVAGFIGMAPIAMIIWALGMIVGMSRSPAGMVIVILGALVLPLGGLVGSRALATSLARMTRTRRGGDVAGLIAAAGGATVFAVLQVARFIGLKDLDPLVDVLRWTPPGMVGAALEGASRGEVLVPALELVPLALVIAVAGWWWTRQLDALLTNTARAQASDPIYREEGSIAIFSGLRRRLPHSSAGAALAREVVYLRRSPSRRAALISGSLLGVVYVVVFVQPLHFDAGRQVLAAPLAMLFSVQFAGNQLGVDPTSFWLDVVTGAPPMARFVGRQLLAGVTLFVPVALSAIGLAAWGGAWVECIAALVATTVMLPSVTAVGSMASPWLAVPIPDSGNPFSNRQTLGGNGCMAGLVGFTFMLLVACLIVPIELGLNWSFHDGQPLWTILILGAAVALNAVVWRTATRRAARGLVRRELIVLDRLDARLSK